jgi:DNA-binding CsgD family transcriptional regulator/GAF domain-containing protein
MGLLQPLYAAGVTEDGWSIFLKQLSIVMGSDAGAIAILDTQLRPIEIFASGAFSTQLFDEYAAHFAAIDPWPAAFTASGRPLGQHVCSHELLSPGEFAKTEYYADLWRPHGDLFHTCGALIPIDDLSLANFAIPRSRRRGPYTPEDVTIMNMLSPHVTMALKLRAELAKTRRHANSLETLFDDAIDALVLLDETGRVLYANRAARAEIAHGKHIAVHNGRLKAGRTIDERSLDLAIRESRDVAGSQRAVPVTRICNGDGKIPSSAITCFPLTRYVAEIALREARATVLVVVANTPYRSPSTTEILRRLFKLTETEAKLAKCISEGASLHEAATVLHIGIGTARAHLKHVFAKTGTKRQGQLVALVLGHVPRWRGQH